MKPLFLAVAIIFAGIAQGQNGLCLKYAGTANDLNNDTLQVFSLNGDSFTQLTKVADGRVSYRSLKLKSKPESNFTIFPDNSYRMIPDVQIKDYVIKVLGKEKIGNYNCTKISVATFVNGKESVMWITDEVPEYKNYIGVTIVDFKLERINEALKKYNVSGIPVKIAYNVQGNLSFELVKASACEVNADMFNLDRYTNSKPPAPAPEK